MSNILTIIVSLSLLALPARAAESMFQERHALLDPTPQERPHELSFLVGLPWYRGYGFGVGGTYAIPVVKNGFIPRINNSVEVEFDGGYAYLGEGFGAIDATANGRWTFHFTQAFAAYAKLGVGLAIVPGGIVPVLVGGPGMLYNFSRAVALRLEVTSFGLRGGVAFDF